MSYTEVPPLSGVGSIEFLERPIEVAARETIQVLTALLKEEDENGTPRLALARAPEIGNAVAAIVHAVAGLPIPGPPSVTRTEPKKGPHPDYWGPG